MGKAWPALDIHVPGCDPQLQELVLAELDDFQPTAIQEADESSPLARVLHDARIARRRRSRPCGRRSAVICSSNPLDVEDEDWAARSQAQLRAITIGRLVIAPPWDVTYRPRQDGV